MTLWTERRRTACCPQAPDAQMTSKRTLDEDRPVGADLHLHSRASDGALTPSQLVQACAGAGLTHIALTDHETISGVPEAKRVAGDLGIQFIPGVEINTAGSDHVHILLYFVHEGMGELMDMLADIYQERMARGPKIISKLNELGINISLNDLDIQKDTAIGRLHVALALKKLGIVQDEQQAFERYLDVRKPAYVPRKRYETMTVIQMARKLGALPVLAHPELIRDPSLKSREALAELKEAGLAGLEAFHSQQTKEECRQWELVARQLGFLITGGSDYHSDNDSHGAIGSQLERWTQVQEDMERFMSRRA